MKLNNYNKLLFKYLFYRISLSTVLQGPKNFSIQEKLQFFTCLKGWQKKKKMNLDSPIV